MLTGVLALQVLEFVWQICEQLDIQILRRIKGGTISKIFGEFFIERSAIWGGFFGARDFFV